MSIIEWEEGDYEIAHLYKGEVSYTYMNDVLRFNRVENMEERVAELVSEIVADYFNGESEVEEQFVVETFTHRVWGAVIYDYESNDITYDMSTVHTNTDFQEEESIDKNQETRKTFKGLVNYIDRFDR